MKKELHEAIKIAGKVADNWLPLKIQYDHTPGIVVCIAVNGVPKYTQAFGTSDIATATPMHTDAQFRVASMSKMFTAVAIMQLQEAGKLRIDDRVATYVPWFTGKSGKTNLDNVTIRQLLSHNAGIFRDGQAKQWINDQFPATLEGTVSNQSVIFENATTFKYSNHGYAVLGAVIEAVSKQSYTDYVTEHIITALALKNTLPDVSETPPKKLVAGYQRWMPDTSERQPEPYIQTHAYAPATGFVATAKDLATFLASLHLDSKKTVLGRESKKEMMRIHGVIEDGKYYGLGLSLNTISQQHTYGHSGGFAGYTTNAMSEPDANIQVIVLSNTINATAWMVSSNLMRLIYKLKGSKDISYTENDPYSGVYRCRWNDLVVVSLGKDLAAFSAAAANPVSANTLYKKEKQHTYRDTNTAGLGNVGESIQFKQIKNGKAQAITADGTHLERIL